MTTTLQVTRLYRLGLALIAFRVFDDTVLQPPAGSAVVSALVPLTVLALAAFAPARWRPGLAALFGLLGVASGADAVYYAHATGVSLDDLSGFVAIVAGLGLIGLSVALWWRTRLRPLTAFGALAGLAFAVFPLCVGYVGTHVARAQVPPNHLGVPSHDVTFRSSDGLKLRGWYVPSHNGAVVIVFPGRQGPQRQSRMLIRHGYGVLLFDRRGEGRSEGRPNAWGWGGDADIKGAVAWLRSRGVERIGGLGLSVGGELMLEAAAEDTGLDAVVSEGAGARTMREEFDAPGKAWHERVGGILQYGFRDLAVAVSTGDAPPPHLETLVPKIAPRPVLLIAAPNSPNGEQLNRRYARGSGAQLWEIPEAEHMGGLAARPAEYERRVVGFFDTAL